MVVYVIIILYIDVSLMFINTQSCTEMREKEEHVLM